MANFRVGQKVVCVDDTFDRDTIEHILAGAVVDLPIRREIYTVRATMPDGGVFLAEVVNPDYIEWDSGIGEVYFDCNRFRPLISSQKHFSIFKEILVGTRQPEGVEA